MKTALLCTVLMSTAACKRYDDRPTIMPEGFGALRLGMSPDDVADFVLDHQLFSAGVTNQGKKATKAEVLESMVSETKSTREELGFETVGGWAGVTFVFFDKKLNEVEFESSNSSDAIYEDFVEQSRKKFGTPCTPDQYGDTRSCFLNLCQSGIYYAIQQRTSTLDGEKFITVTVASLSEEDSDCKEASKL